MTKRVCKVCNEGWMETNVERPVQSILGPMILGQSTVLDLAAQSRLAAWAAKTAMVARYAESPPLGLDRRWLDHMYRNQLAPDSWYVWISKYQGERPVFYKSADITLSFPGDIPDTPHGVLTTLVIGYVGSRCLELIPVHPRTLALASCLDSGPPAATPLSGHPSTTSMTSACLRSLPCTWISPARCHSRFLTEAGSARRGSTGLQILCTLGGAGVPSLTPAKAALTTRPRDILTWVWLPGILLLAVLNR